MDSVTTTWANVALRSGAGSSHCKSKENHMPANRIYESALCSDTTSCC